MNLLGGDRQVRAARDPGLRHFAEAALLKTAAEAEARGWKVAQEKNDEYKRLLSERGMKIHKPSPKLDADMRQVGATMQADWLKLAGADGAAIVDAYKQK